MELFLSVDRHFFLLVNHLPHNALFDGLAATLSGIGKAGIIWFVLGVILFIREERKHHTFFIPIVTAGTASWILVDLILKPLIARPRPTDILTDYSFPSSHATIAFAMAGVLSSYEPRLKKIFYTLATLIAFSRIFLGVHYPLDVVAGAGLGLAIGVVTKKLMRAGYDTRRKR